MDRDHLTSLRRWFKKYDFKTFRMYAGPLPYIIILDPKIVEQVLSSTILINKEDIYTLLYPWLGNGLLTANGRHWVSHRKMITPSFHFQILQDFLHIINKTTDRFMDLLNEYANKTVMFDFQDIVTRCTIDIICETALGTRVNAIEGEKSPIVTAMNNVSEVIQKRAFSAVLRSDFLFSLTPNYRVQQRALKVLRSEISSIIHKRRELVAALRDNGSNSNDGNYKRPKMAFLDNLITAVVDGRPLTFQEIFEEVNTFVFEGHDTTAGALTFAIFCLSRHPEIQAKAFSEQLLVFGDDIKRNPTYLELQEMKYLELVIKETLRIFPSVPIIARNVEQPTKIDGRMVPKNTTILVPIIGIGTNERYFAEPFKFRPERFETDKRTNANPFDYVPFSAGPRNCIGQKFAMMEMKVTISKIVRHFEILPAVDGLASGIHDTSDLQDVYDNPYDPRLATPVTLKSVNGVYVRLRRRVY